MLWTPNPLLQQLGHFFIGKNKEGVKIFLLSVTVKELIQKEKD